MRLEYMRPYLADASLERAQMRALIASREQGLEFSKDVSAAARWVRLHPGENLLPLPGERIFAGPSPVQDTRSFLLLLGKLFCFSCFLEDKLRRASCEIKRHQLRYRCRLADGGSPSFTAKGRLLQVFHLLEEPKRVKRFRDSTQFLLLGSGQHSRGQNPLQRRFGRVVDPMDRSSLNLFRHQLHRRLKVIHIPM